MDNAATSFPKPPVVMEAMARYANELGASAGRGAYFEAVQTGTLIAQCRQRLCELFNGEKPEHFIFTLNCTDALNLAIKGLIHSHRNAHVVCTAIDHNSVLRPLNALAEQGLACRTIVPVDPQTGLVDPDDIRRAIRSGTCLVVVTHASNVTGTVQPLAEIGRICRERDVVYLVDAAQSAGHLPIDLQADNIDLLAAPGHKGLLGPLGTGLLYIRPGIESRLSTVREGGTGSLSELDLQPGFLPDRFEAGSHNAIGIAGLLEGVNWILREGICRVHEHEKSLIASFIEGISSIPGLRLYGPQGVSHRTSVFSVRINGYDPHGLAAELEKRYGILTRPGLHCAPLIHRTLGTLQQGGTTRFSFWPFLTVHDIQYAADALAELALSRKTELQEASS